MTDFHAHVTLALGTLAELMGSEHSAEVRCQAASAVLEFIGKFPAAQEPVCQHDPGRRRNLSTMGGGPLREECSCGALFENGEQVVR